MANKKQEDLTSRQEIFAQNIALGMTKTKAALKAGYSPKTASNTASSLTSDKNHKVQERITFLQKGAANRVMLSLSTHLLDLMEIRDKALSKGSFSAAVAAEVARGKAAGLYVTKSELTINKIESMSKEEIIERLNDMYKQTGGVLPDTKIIDLKLKDETKINGTT
jgi:phage terminase small subunit|tara:strand:+ start:733 stop:1230 length:498 start_codon:yes stop_codon:yes gene_type:complete